MTVSLHWNVIRMHVAVTRVMMLMAMSMSRPVMNERMRYASDILELSSPLPMESKNDTGRVNILRK